MVFLWFSYGFHQASMLPSGPAHATALVARWVATARATAGDADAASRQKSIMEPTAKLRRWFYFFLKKEVY